MKKKRGKKMIIFLSIVGILAITVTSVLLYYNKAFPEALDIAATMDKVGSDYYFHGDSNVGFIIFSGAKADEKGYAYIAKLLHDEGHTVVIPEVPFHLSAFGTNHGFEIMAANPEIEKWFLIGHSVGGVPISRIAAQKPANLQGLAFVASIMSTDLSELDISAIHIMASNDNFYSEANRANEHLEYLPKHSVITTIQGASHQGFAAVHGRDGGGTISWKEQQEQTVRLILDFFDAQINDGS
ncbi:MAG: alpha/beta hydrolase [Candidatus Pelethousia sp.]|nr:alpha/beta hydrolase [Candidatus Pelethousia sp.]